MSDVEFDTKPLARDFTPTGLKVEGSYENDRNSCFAQLFEDMICEAYGVKKVIIAHHLTYVKVDRRVDKDGREYDYQIVEEIPSADALIFDHDVAKKLWGDQYKGVLTRLALEPCETRDQFLASLYYRRQK